ncbi:MAG: SLC13 family permease [Lactovum sp.]
MTLDMTLALGILVLMIVMIMSDKFAFGAPPIFACLLVVATGLGTVPEAFAGFINPTVVMIAGFMVVMAALMKTSLMEKIQSAMYALVEKGGYKSYALLVFVVMLGTSLVGMGNTGYYVLILSLVAALPYNKNMPTSKLLMPLGFATNHPLIPFNVALMFGISVSLLETTGYTETLSMMKYSGVMLILSLAFLAWTLIAYKILPDHPIMEANEEENVELEKEAEKTSLPQWKEYVTIAAFVASVVGMMMMSQLGDIAYIVPGLAASVIMFVNVLDFKEVRDNMGAPVILMMAGVIGVADALGRTGFTTMLGEKVAEMMGADASPFIILLIFTLLTSTCATFTGSNMGSVYIFAPIAIATCASLGVSPVAAAVAVTISGWNGGYMPIDGMPAMILGMGKYKLPQFWAFAVPMYLIRIAAICIGAMLMFPF